MSGTNEHRVYSKLTATQRLPPYTKQRHKYIVYRLYIIILFRDSVRSSFPSRSPYAILGTGILGQIASFERRRRGAAQTLLALTRYAPGRDRVRELGETSEKFAKFCILGCIRPRYSWILEYAELERKITWENVYPQVGIISKLVSYSIPTTFFHDDTSKHFAYYCAHRTTDCCVAAFRHRISRLNTFFVRAFVVIEGGR